MITIINYGMGNVGSILNMLKKTGAEAVISSDISQISKAAKLILPGVGAFDAGMKNLLKSNLAFVLKELVFKEKKPILGICLGMQLMTGKSEEGIMDGLGWIDAETVRFNFDESKIRLRIPHMGWNSVKPVEGSILFKDMYENPRFYFVHSYHVVCKQKKDIQATTLYGYDFVSAMHRDNIWGVQFHPEKSHKFGMKLLKNFVELS